MADRPPETPTGGGSPIPVVTAVRHYVGTNTVAENEPVLQSRPESRPESRSKNPSEQADTSTNNDHDSESVYVPSSPGDQSSDSQSVPSSPVWPTRYWRRASSPVTTNTQLIERLRDVTYEELVQMRRSELIDIIGDMVLIIENLTGDAGAAGNGSDNEGGGPPQDDGQGGSEQTGESQEVNNSQGVSER